MTTPSTPRIFDPTFRDLVRDATPIEDLVNADLRAAGHPPLSGHGDEREGWHSVHGSQSGASLKVNVAKQVYTCFNCGEGGDVFSWLMQAQRCSFVEALHTLAQRAGIPLPHLDAAQQQQWQQAQQERHDLEGLFRAAATFFHAQLTQEHRDFCVQQWGLTAETIERYQLGFAPDDPAALQRTLTGQHFTRDLVRKSGLVIQVGSSWHDLFQGRLIFPYWRDLPDPQTQQPGTPLYFIGRRIDGVTPDRAWEAAKYRKQLVHSPKHPYVSPAVTNTYFYGEHVLRGMKDVPLLVTEGVADCLAAMQVGIPTISPVTVRFSKASYPRLLQLAQKAKRLIICNDNEASGAGFKGALETAAFLDENGVDVRLITLPRPAGTAKVDLADYLRTHTTDEFHLLCAQALEYVEARMRTYPVGADPYTNCLTARQFVVDVLAHRPRRQDALAFLRHRTAPYFGLSPADLVDLFAVYQQRQAPPGASPSPDGQARQEPQASPEPLSFLPALLSFQELLALKIPERKRYIEWLPERGLVMVYGPRGAGKTMFMLGLATALTTGEAFLTWPVSHTTGVLYVDGEMPISELRDRTVALAGAAIPQGLHFLTGEMVYERLHADLTLTGADARSAIEAVLDAHPAMKIVILDNISCLFAGISEDKKQDWEPTSAWLVRLRHRGITVVLVHHAGKGGQQRGTSGREDALDAVIALSYPENYNPEDGCHFHLRFEKSRAVKGDAVASLDVKLEDGASGLTWTQRPLDASARERIVEMLSDGMSPRDIAAEMEVSMSYVYRIKRAHAAE